MKVVRIGEDALEYVFELVVEEEGSPTVVSRKLKDSDLRGVCLFALVGWLHDLGLLKPCGWREGLREYEVTGDVAKIRELARFFLEKEIEKVVAVTKLLGLFQDLDDFLEFIRRI